MSEKVIRFADFEISRYETFYTQKFGLIHSK